MTTTNDGGPAFPLQSAGPGFAPGYSGMSLRDHFAGLAMQGFCVGCCGILGAEFSAYAKQNCNAVIAERAYVLADAMLAERERKP